MLQQWSSNHSQQRRRNKSASTTLQIDPPAVLPVAILRSSILRAFFKHIALWFFLYLVVQERASVLHQWSSNHSTTTTKKTVCVQDTRHRSHRTLGLPLPRCTVRNRLLAVFMAAGIHQVPALLPFFFLFFFHFFFFPTCPPWLYLSTFLHVHHVSTCPPFRKVTVCHLPFQENRLRTVLTTGRRSDAVHRLRTVFLTGRRGDNN